MLGLVVVSAYSGVAGCWLLKVHVANWGWVEVFIVGVLLADRDSYLWRT